MMYWIDLQEIVTGAVQRSRSSCGPPQQPFGAAGRGPENWCLLTPSTYIRDVFRKEPERNPSGVQVMTTDMALRKGFPAPNVVLLGHSRIGNLSNKFHRAIRMHRLKRKGP